jgi:hypothetical protein
MLMREIAKGASSLCVCVPALASYLPWNSARRQPLLASLLLSTWTAHDRKAAASWLRSVVSLSLANVSSHFFLGTRVRGPVVLSPQSASSRLSDGCDRPRPPHTPSQRPAAAVQLTTAECPSVSEDVVPREPTQRRRPRRRARPQGQGTAVSGDGECPKVSGFFVVLYNGIRARRRFCLRQLFAHGEVTLNSARFSTLGRCMLPFRASWVGVFRLFGRWTGTAAVVRRWRRADRCVIGLTWLLSGAFSLM